MIVTVLPFDTSMAASSVSYKRSRHVDLCCEKAVIGQRRVYLHRPPDQFGTGMPEGVNQTALLSVGYASSTDERLGEVLASQQSR